MSFWDEAGFILDWSLVVYGKGWAIRTFWTQKVRQEKLTKFIKILNYIKSSSICFLCQSVLTFPVCIYTKRINIFWSRGISSILQY